MVAVAAHITPSLLRLIAAEYRAQGPRLLAADSLPFPQGESPVAAAGQLLPSWLARFPVQELSLALSPELAAMVHSFPLETASPAPDALAEAAEFELAQLLTDYDRAHYATFVLPLHSSAEVGSQAVAITYTRADLQLLRALHPLTTPAVLPDLFTVPALWRYNYPELSTERVALMHLQPPYADVFLLENGAPTLFRSFALEEASPQELAYRCCGLLSELAPEGFEELFLFGQAVRRELLEAFQGQLSVPCRRLNPFRMWLPPEDERVRAYAIRTAHLFWGCVGVCLPSPEEIFHL